MTIDAALAEAVRSAVAPLAEEVRALRAEVAELLRSQPPRLVSVEEAAAALGVSACTIRRWEHDQQIASVRRGGRVLIDLSTVRPTDPAQIAALARQARTPSLSQCDGRR